MNSDLLKEKIKDMYYFRKNNYYINKYYKSWIKKNEPNREMLKIQENEKFNFMPKISIVIPMYNTDKAQFEILINSLINQTYKNIEICLADGSQSENQELKQIISKDKRIKYKFLNKNGGISENTNEAIKMAEGEYILFADHDDVLPRFCVYEVVKAINNNMDADFIYSDHDIIIGKRRCNPHFKPDFSEDTLRSYNYICHVAVVKKELLDKVGYLNKEYDGAQDYDLILRITEKSKKIVHIPKILYHWRSHRRSTAGNSSSKLYVYEAGKKAIQEHLIRMNLPYKEVKIEREKGRYRVVYDIKEKDMVSIIIPNKDSTEDLKKCIEAIKNSATYKNIEIIVVENNSTTKEIFDYYESLKKCDNINVIKYETNVFNYSKINNFGATFAKGKYLLFLNNDTEIISDNFIEEMLGLLQRENVGIVGAKLLYPDRTVQHAGVIIGMGGVAGHINKNIKDEDPGYYSRASIINNFSAVTAACFMTKKEIFDRLGGFDERLAVAFNDIDFCLKVIKANYLCVYTPYAKLYHYESKSRGLENTKEKKERFLGEIKFFSEKWKDVLEKKDPYFNINLRLDSAKFLVENRKRIDY